LLLKLEVRAFTVRVIFASHELELPGIVIQHSGVEMFFLIMVFFFHCVLGFFSGVIRLPRTIIV